MLEDYLRRFAKLRTDTSSARWSADTNHRAPHKPFLLLAVMDLVAQGRIQTNFIEFDSELMDTFDLYWVKVIGREKASTPILPFYHLQSDKFWHLVPVSGMEQALAAVRQIRSVSQLHQLVMGAKLDDEIFTLLLEEESRDKLRRALIDTYFAPEVHEKLVEVGQITAESFEYSRELLGRVRGRFSLGEAPAAGQRYHTESRSTAFRRIVTEAYNHTCAMCRLRIVTPEADGSRGGPYCSVEYQPQRRSSQWRRLMWIASLDFRPGSGWGGVGLFHYRISGHTLRSRYD